MIAPTSGPDRFDTSDGLTLEAHWNVAEEPAAVVVFCHPHPQDDGTMSAPLMKAIAGRLADRGAAVLRFNFRGVGESEGGWGGGVEEVLDVEAAVAHAARHLSELPHVLCGWSFGAVTSLRWQAEAKDSSDWIGIAPPPRLSTGGTMPHAAALAPARRLIVIGDRDQFATVDEVETYADSIGAATEVFRGSDHFFYFREQRVADLMADWFGLSGGTIPTPV